MNYQIPAFKHTEEDGHKHKNAMITLTANETTKRMTFYRCGYCGKFPYKKVKKIVKKVKDKTML